MHPIRLICILSIALAACGEEEHHATRDDVLTSCRDFEATVGERFGDCLGWDQAMTASFITENQASCPDALEAESCWDRQHENYVSCADHTAERDCASLCPDGFCFVYCPYFCPE